MAAGRHGRLALAAILTACAVASAARAAEGAVRPVHPGRACERTQVRKVALGGAAEPQVLSVRATGPSCGQAWIVVTLRAGPGGRVLWTERAFLGAVESGRLPGEATGQDVTFEHVIAAVEGWVSIEKTGAAPPWPPGDRAPVSADARGSTQYDSPLARSRYLRIRAADEPMLCIPVGPEAAHCLAMDADARRLVVFLGRGA